MKNKIDSSYKIYHLDELNKKLYLDKMKLVKGYDIQNV